MPPSEPERAAARVRAFIGLGANLGNARATLESAVSQLATLPDTTLAARSSFYRTAPVDAAGPDFVNAVVELHTGLAPIRLLEALQDIERSHGRERPYRNAPRTLDLDLLLYGNEQIEAPVLTVPHPRAHERAFVLKPLLELDPAIRLVGRGAARELLDAVGGQDVERLL